MSDARSATVAGSSGPAQSTLAQPDLAMSVRQVLQTDDLAGSTASRCLERLIERGLDRLPLPGSGGTLQRWRGLAAVARHDLSLAKLYEGHTDALAILAELRAAPSAAEDLPERAASWGVWAAEAPGGRVTLVQRADAPSDALVELRGRKCWCSGATTASHALLTAWFEAEDQPCLVSVRLGQPGISVDAAPWQAVGMPGSASVDVLFDGAVGHLVGQRGAYLSRPGFWHGGAGIAACWYGGAMALADSLRQALQGGPARSPQPFRLAALAKVDLALRGTAALLREAAANIDASPMASAFEPALRVRLSAEQTAGKVLDEVGRALGATPYCRDARFARFAADLPVFVRQSHAERDFEALGGHLLTSAPSEDGGWWL